jgi:hypothetical protein
VHLRNMSAKVRDAVATTSANFFANFDWFDDSASRTIQLAHRRHVPYFP